MHVTRRHLQLGLAALWIVDGALQCQRYMFTKSFGREVILGEAATGTPWWVAHPAHWAADIIITHPVLTNAGFAAFQLALGTALLWRRTVRVALLGSVAWGLLVWWLGEGIGGLTTGETLLSGAPGAALLYAVVAVTAWPDRTGASDVRPSLLALPAWCALWVMGAGMQLAAGNNSGDALAAAFEDGGMEAMGWIRHLDNTLARHHISDLVVAAIIAVEVLIALWATIPGRARIASAYTGIGVGVAAWVLVQGLGDLTTGQSTDPNTGPLIVLMAFAVLGLSDVSWNDNRRHASRSATRPRTA
ncbi:MAG: hypothetical protein JO246_10015 [Frankiaceae bacterium]|nr:hypothetical protein [Frankiaceae bacterium]MBV9872867.1 hypothetical protein [Frankiaceae bacterium]